MLQAEVNHASAEPAVSWLAMETMGDRIRVLREAKGWTQEGLAARLTARGAKISGNAVSQWERSETANVKLPTFLVLVEELGTTHEYLVHGRSEPNGRDSSGRYRRLRPGDNTGNKA